MRSCSRSWPESTSRASSPTWWLGTSISLHPRQLLLETLSVEERLRRVLVHVQRQIGVLDAQEDIKSQVQEELGERQREMFLREQLKTIQRELGEGDERDDLQELKDKLAALDLVADARKEVDREFAGSPGSGANRWSPRSFGRSLRMLPSCPGMSGAESTSSFRRPAHPR